MLYATLDGPVSLLNPIGALLAKVHGTNCFLMAPIVSKAIKSGWLGLSSSEPSKRADADLYEG